MFFILLVFATALFIEGLGSIISVLGVSKLFGLDLIIIALAISLDIGKVVVVSLLYTYWHQLSRLMKAYALLAALVTMTITSVGAAGYLTGAFQIAVVDTKEGELKVSLLKEQQAKYEQRKKQIDDQIAKLPEKTTVGQRLRLIRSFKAEQEALNAKIAAIDKELPALQLKQLDTEAKAGPITVVAKALNVPIEEAVKWVVFLIIFVFDPLAIFLIIAGNFLWANRKKECSLSSVDNQPRDINDMEITSWPPAPSLDPAYDAHGYADFDHRSDFEFDPSYDKRRNEPPLYERLYPSQRYEAPLSQPFTSEAPPVKSSSIEADLAVEEPLFEPERSSLNLVEPDPKTIVDARHLSNFGKAKTLKKDL